MNTNVPFYAADVLIPRVGHEKFATIACDQYTSEPEYWADVASAVGNEPSALKITLPEVYLGDGDTDERIAAINAEMKRYLEANVFAEYPDAMVYVERTLPGGMIRRGLVGAVDLEHYDYAPDSRTLIRATEGTVPERLPPRVRIRRDAPLELPHVMLLIDDPRRTVIEPLTGKVCHVVYDFDLMFGAGHLHGSLIEGDMREDVTSALAALVSATPVGENPLLFAVGDGNHSLATALECYRAYKKSASEAGEDVTSDSFRPLCRYALVEIVNIHDTALVFEPIYRVVFGIDPEKFIAAAQTQLAAAFSSDDPTAPENPVVIVTAVGEAVIPSHSFPVGAVQAFVERYISENGGTVDYVHGESSARKLAASDASAAILFRGMEKSELFPYVRANGPLPRKAFSMGEAAGKRFYIEGRRIR